MVSTLLGPTCSCAQNWWDGFNAVRDLLEAARSAVVHAHCSHLPPLQPGCYVGQTRLGNLGSSSSRRSDCGCKLEAICIELCIGEPLLQHPDDFGEQLGPAAGSTVGGTECTNADSKF